MTTLANALLAIQAPKGVIPDRLDREGLVRLADYLNGLALGMDGGKPGESRVDMLKGSTDVALAQPYALITLATCVALTEIDINGVIFTALATGTSTVAHNEFTISGADAADATELSRAINAAAAGEAASGTITISGGSGNYTATVNGRTTATVAWDTSDTITAAALVAQINRLPRSVTEPLLVSNAAGVITLTARVRGTAGNAHTLAVTGTGATASGSRLTGGTAVTASAVAGMVQACNLATTIALATVLAGTVITIDGVKLTAVQGAPDRVDTFNIGGTDTVDGESLAATINAHPYLSRRFLATAAAGTVTLRQKSGTVGLGLQASAATVTLGAAAPAAVSAVLVTSTLPGVFGNSLTVSPRGIAATTTATCVSVVATDTLVVNGQTLTAIVQRATGTLTHVNVVPGNTCVIHGVTFTAVAGATGVGKPNSFTADGSDTDTAADMVTQINAHPTLSGVVTATNVAGVVTVRAVTAGTAGNSIVLTGTAVVLAASGSGTLEGGIAVANNQFDCSPGSTDTQVAADIVRAIGASTTTLLSTYVRATNLAGVVTLYSKFPGTVGNGITAVSTGGTITVAAARLAGATSAAYEGVQASGTLTPVSWANGETVVVNGVTITAHTNTQANNQVDISGTNDADAANLALAINNSTTAALKDVVATVSTNVVTVTARRGGISGNLITLTGHANCAASAARLTSGAVPVTVVFGSTRLAGGVGADAASASSFP